MVMVAGRGYGRQLVNVCVYGRGWRLLVCAGSDSFAGVALR